MDSSGRFSARILVVAVLAVAPLAAAVAEGRRPAARIPRPAAYPVPAVPADNPYSAVKAELGRMLFYDRRLSGNGTFSCATCHRQERAFTDGRRRALGSTDQEHRRNTMSLTNVAYAGSFNWADGTTRSLEEQMLVPMFGHQPVELGLAGHEERVLADLAALPRYRQLFAAAFPEAQVPAGRAPISMTNVIRAIATFERTLISAGSAYDGYLLGADSSRFTAEARRGLKLFFSEKLRCSQCHAGFSLAGNTTWYERPPAPLSFHNTGLYNLRRSSYPAADQGLIEQTGRRRDNGKFKAPTLRNIELTAPYMHDGSVATLEEVIAHYEAGGRTLSEGPMAGVGRRNRFKSDRIVPIDLRPDERRDLLAFLRSLTDEEFVTNPRFADPFSTAPAQPGGR